MATILQVATHLAGRLGRPDPAVYIRRARERGWLPHSGRGGRGSIGTPPADTPHGLLLLLAMLLPAEPKRAVELARECLGFGLFEPQRWTARDGIVTSGAIWGEGFAPTAGEALAGIINGYRAGLGAVAPMCPVALRVGEKWGHRCLEIVTKALAPAADGTEWGIALVYSPSGTPALSDDDVVVAGRSVMCETGGSIFAELADMLGPLASSSGGGGDPLVREHDALDAEDDDLPLAAAPADAPGAALVH